MSSRYSNPDDYTIEELRRTYERSDGKQKIRLIRILQKKHELPLEIARLVVSDSNVEVREWYAKNGDFQPRISSKVYKAGEGDGWELSRRTSHELENALRNDPDPFVRACLHENSHAFGSYSGEAWVGYFAAANHLERLAAMRNMGVDEELVKRVFDPDNADLKINIHERAELAFAFLSNEHKIHKLKDRALLCEEHEVFKDFYTDGFSDYAANSFFDFIWRQAEKWPIDTGVAASIFQSVPVRSQVKAEMFRRFSHPSQRMRILDSCKSWKQDDAVKLGLTDSDEGVRECAFATLHHVSSGFVKGLIKKADKIAMKGLARNPSTPTEDLRGIDEWFKEHEPGEDTVWMDVRRNLSRRPEEPDTTEE
jgi:hypothetical protein